MQQINQFISDVFTNFRKYCEKNDKKRIDDKYNFILLNDIGSSYISDKIKTSQLKDILRNR